VVVTIAGGDDLSFITEGSGCLAYRTLVQHAEIHGEPGGIRTHGPKIKSLVLYQLSYGLAGAL
jgi:hypothetical protein